MGGPDFGEKAPYTHPQLGPATASPLSPLPQWHHRIASIASHRITADKLPVGARKVAFAFGVESRAPGPRI